MMDLYKVLSFVNNDGGAWKQGWDVQVEDGRFTPRSKLKVFVIPHSHNDPGEAYYGYSDRKNNICLYLKSKKLRKSVLQSSDFCSMSYRLAENISTIL